MSFNTNGGNTSGTAKIDASTTGGMDVCRVEKPLPGELSSVVLDGETHYEFKIDMDNVKSVTNADGTLTLVFKDDAKIVFENVQDTDLEVSEHDASSIMAQKEFLNSMDVIKELIALMQVFEDRIEKDSTDLDAQVKYAALETSLAEKLSDIEPAGGQSVLETQTPAAQDAALAQQLSEIEPAAGESGAAGGRGGYGFNSSFDPQGVEGLVDVGPIDPTALEYRANFYEPEGFRKDSDDPGKPPVDPNDVPIIAGPSTNAVDETDGGPLIANGKIEVDFGRDSEGSTIKPDGGHTVSGSLPPDGLTSGGHPVTIVETPTGYEGSANGETVFTLVIDPSTGEYTYTQVKTFDHGDTTDHNDVITLEFGVVATDGDGDSAQTTITIDVFDDGVLANNDYQFFDPDLGAATGNVVTGENGGPGAADELGADNPHSVTKISFNGIVVKVPETGVAVIDGKYGQLKISADGSYTYTKNPAFHEATVDEFQYTITDGDGDTSQATLTLESPEGVFIDLSVNNDVEHLYIKEDGQGTVPVTATYTGGDGDEVMTLKVTGVDPSWEITAQGWENKGGGVYVLTLPAGQSTYNGEFTFKPPADSDVDMTGLHFTASVYNPDNGITKTDAQDFSVHVDAVVDAPVLVVPETIHQAWYYHNQSYAVPLAISSHVTDTDGSEVITKITINLNNPFTNPVAPFYTLDDMGIGLNKGTEVSPGVWEIPVNAGDTAAALNGLALVVPAGQDYWAIHQSITGGHSANITVISHVKEQNLSGQEWDYSDNETTVVKNINLNFVITPLVLDLDGNGIDLVNIEAGVLFDMNNDGIPDNTSWITGGDGFLALDANGDGIINNQSELFGNSETAADGFQNLAQYDTNNDGRIDANDEVFDELLVWRDVNGDGVSQPGELSLLSEFNIVAINLNPTLVDQADGDSVIMYTSTFEYADGTEGEIADVGFNVRDGAAGNEGAHIEGTAGSDVIYGTDSNDTIIGHGGADVIYGGGGADTFLFDAIAKGVDVIRDFSTDEGDVLDFSSLLHNYDPTQQAIDDFIFSRDTDGGTIISIDANGTGDISNAVDIVALEGIHNLNVQDMLQTGNIHVL